MVRETNLGSDNNNDAAYNVLQLETDEETANKGKLDSMYVIITTLCGVFMLKLIKLDSKDYLYGQHTFCATKLICYQISLVTKLYVL
jgi:hypothetical protein